MLKTIILGASLFLITSQGWAAITVVQSATQVNVSASSTTAPSITLAGVTAGNTLIAFAGIYDANTTWSLTNTTDGVNTYTTRQASATKATDKNITAVAVAVNVAAGSTTVSFNLSGTSAGANRYYALGLIEVSGVATSAAEDAQATTSNIDTSGATDASAGTITTTDTGDLIVGAATVNSADATLNFGSPASWTNAYRQNDSSEFGFGSLDAGYWLPGSIQTTYTAQWSHDNNAADVGAGVVVALKPAAAVVVGCRLLQDGTSKRLLQDGSSGRIFQGGGSGCGGSAPPTVVPVRALLGVGL